MSSKKHNSSILICELEDGTLNLYVNGASVLINCGTLDEKQVSFIHRIANCNINETRAIQILDTVVQRLKSLEELKKETKKYETAS